MRVLFTPRADRQMADLFDYVSDHASEVVATRYLGRIVAFCEALDVFPLRGQQRNDILPGLRTVGFERRITIAFVVETEAVLIEGIFYGGQDFESLLKPGET